MARIVNISNRLPVTVGQAIRKSSGGLVAALEGLAKGEDRLTWIGWPGGPTPDEARQHEIRQVLAKDYGCVPVFMSADEIAGFYEGFSNSSLWPVLHYMPTRMRYHAAWWDQYREVNRRFAEAALAVAEDGDLVWVHDYQLMLVPEMLRRERPELRVGFFLHTPFPAADVFRCHPRRDDLLAGMLGADLVGFHTFGYLRQFRGAVQRLLGIDPEMMSLRGNGHETRLGVFPIGINAGRFEEELASDRFAAALEKARSVYAGKRIVLSVERLDYSKGLPRRLQAIDLFLSRLKERDSIKFIFISVPSREKVEDYRLLREETERRIGRLNGKHATLHNSPIHFLHQSVDFTELCALYAIADVGLVTPLVDGMNLVAKEYVACQREDPGALVLSEFAGAAEELFSAVLVNPYDVEGMADALEQALAMPAAERSRRMREMRPRVMRQDARAWARQFIDELSSRPAAPEHGAPIEEARRHIAEALEAQRPTAFFLDYDGTLREIERTPAAARPNAALLELLEQLRSHPGLATTIVSGRTAEEMESFLGDWPFGLVAEHGAALRRPGRKEWEQVDRNASYAWKEQLLPVLRLFEQTTPGSFIEDKRTSLVWHYRRADPEFGAWRARQLVDELAALTAAEPLQVRHGRKIVEITATSVNKGAAVMRLLEDVPAERVLIAGDDETDETMFRLDYPGLVSIKVGPGETRAQHRLPDPRSLRRFLAGCLGGRVPR